MLKRILRSLVPARIWEWMRSFHLRYTLSHYPAFQSEHTYGGVKLAVWLADPLGKGWYDHDWPELPEIEFLQRYRLKEGATVFDLGAHQCVVALMLQRSVGPTGLVLAVEANGHNAAVGEKNRVLNHAENLHIIHAAIAERAGTVKFNRGLNGQIGPAECQVGLAEVKAVTIDDLALEYGIPDVLFIDIEGYECQALSGAKETLKKRPDCFVEVHVGVGLEKLGGSVNTVVTFFPQTDYDLFVASDARPQFERFRRDDDLLASRFFLIAIARQTSLDQAVESTATLGKIGA